MPVDVAFLMKLKGSFICPVNLVRGKYSVSASLGCAPLLQFPLASPLSIVLVSNGLNRCWEFRAAILPFKSLLWIWKIPDKDFYVISLMTQGSSLFAKDITAKV